MTSPTCCGSELQVISLAGSAPGAGVDMVRCGVCARTAWRRDGIEVERTVALEALGQAHPSPGRPPARNPRPPAARPQSAAKTSPRPAATPAAPDSELADLLAGWQVHGS